MHVNSERFTQNLTPEELSHIESCDQCKDELFKLTALKQSAESLQLLQPPQHIEFAVVDRVIKSKRNKRKAPYILIATAASMFCVAVGWLVWNNFYLQYKLEQVLLVNQQLESQLMQSSSPIYNQIELLVRVRQIELKIREAETSSEKIGLLQERKKIMTEMVENTKGQDYEYSI